MSDVETGGPDSTPPLPIWQSRVLCAVAALEHIEQPATRTRIKEMVGARFASSFSSGARLYEDARPRWEARVDEAIAELVIAKLLRAPRGRAAKTATPEPSWALTPRGRDEAPAACAGGLAPDPDVPADVSSPSERNVLIPGVVTKALQDNFVGPPLVVNVEHQYLIRPTEPLQIGLAARGIQAADAVEVAHPVIIELNLDYGATSDEPTESTLRAAIDRVTYMWNLVGATGSPEPVADQYLSGDLTEEQVQNIVTADSAGGDWPERAIFRIWPDFQVRRQIDVSCTTIKALPAQRSFAAYGEGIVWAVIDSGIDASHPHFLGDHILDDASVASLHRDFVSGDDDTGKALVDDDGHGTHVAGIIAGGLHNWHPTDHERVAIAAEKRMNSGSFGDAVPIVRPRPVDIERLAGVAPLTKLVSLRVLSKFGDLDARTQRVMNALAYVRRVNARAGKKPRIHGVNLSLGYDFLADWFACGQSPLCLEVNKTVASGVVVVVAAGNSGYVKLNTKESDVASFSAAITINDPGNAERAITVGSTHRDSPHTNGISYFSSRGPTGDGRCKPDLVAPGELITSAAAGKNLADVLKTRPNGLNGAAAYIQDSGTSMAAPHVSGAIAAFLSIQRELIGQPDEVKRIFKASATSLNRTPDFQGAGMVDLMRALQYQ